MDQLLRVARWAVPAALGGLGGALLLPQGTDRFDSFLGITAGILLGATLYTLLRGSGELLGHATPARRSASRRMRELQRDKQIVLRSIKEIEHDASLGKLDDADAERLISPLRQRALRLLQELDEARVSESAPHSSNELQKRTAPRSGIH